MPCVAYTNWRPSSSTRKMVESANTIIEEYAAQGFSLTLRQLYYQFVSRDLIANTLRSYGNLGRIVNEARMAGMIDWDYITDRTRNLRSNNHWTDPADIINASAASYRIDMWEHQSYRPEVWIEKDALVGVIESVCSMLDVPYFSCRGYTSQSEMWRAGRRMARHAERGQIPIIFHLGDHDPSGKDMTRDIDDRLETFMGGLKINRLALNMDQVEQYKPPPNPAKVTDSRADAYIAEFGSESWELDALEPKVMVGLITKSVNQLIDTKQWAKDQKRHKQGKDLLAACADRWDEVTELLND